MAIMRARWCSWRQSRGKNATRCGSGIRQILPATPRVALTRPFTPTVHRHPLQHLVSPVRGRSLSAMARAGEHVWGHQRLVRPALTAHDSPRADKPPNLKIWCEGRWMTWWTTSPSSSSSTLRSDPPSHGTSLLRCCPTTHTQTQVTQTIRHCAFALDNKFVLDKVLDKVMRVRGETVW